MQRVNRVKLIALDMDGTLLAGDHWTVPQDNVLAIRRAHEAGIHVCICTGRVLEDASDFAHRLGLPVMIIGSNGSRVADAPLPKGRIFYRRDFEPDTAKNVLDSIADMGLMVNVFEDGHVSTLPSEAYPEYHLAKRRLVRVDYGRDAIYAAASRGIMKIFVVGAVEEETRVGLIRNRLRSEFPTLSISCSSPHNIEIVPPDSGKGAALHSMAQHLGLTREEVMAVGDAQNDLSMLEYAYHSVAMGNAEEAVRCVCRYQTATNDECGVARIIERVLASREA